jgi:hypothetical protein
MTWISAFVQWSACALQRLSSWLAPRRLSSEATQARTAIPFAGCDSNWRPLIARSEAPRSRYWIRHSSTPHAFNLHVHDSHYQFTWLCEFTNRSDRAAYLDELTQGTTHTQPRTFLIDIEVRGLR